METNSTRQPELFIRDKKTGRLVFNPRAIEALGLPPSEIARRGYRLPSEMENPPPSRKSDRSDPVTVD